MCVSQFCEARTLSLPLLGLSWISADVYKTKQKMLASLCFMKTVISFCFVLSSLSVRPYFNTYCSYIGNTKLDPVDCNTERPKQIYAAVLILFLLFKIS